MAQPIWNTPSGSVGSFPSGIYLSVTLSANPVLPATSISYIFLSGRLPQGITFVSSGEISGTTSIVPRDTAYTFSIRAIDNLGNLRDRTFSMTISGAATPQFTTPDGSILTVQDSTWVEIPIEFSNPNTNNPVYIEVSEGLLPPGLEINEVGIIRGYPAPPVINSTSPAIATSITATDSSTNSISGITTTGFSIGRPIIFTGTEFGGITAGITYYIKSIINSSTFTISETQNGPTVELSTDIGVMTASLSSITVGQPTIRTYAFSLKLISPLGNDLASYSMTIVNQNAPVSAGGPGLLPNTRIPTILNTRPQTFNIEQNDYENFGYYIVPPKNSKELTVSPSVAASMGKTEDANYFSYRILGYDFDGNLLNYQYLDLPSFLTGDINTGWITGNPTLATQGISQYDFSVRTFKANTPGIISLVFNFSLIVRNGINGTIVWLTSSDLGTIFNGITSTFNVKATSDVDLEYTLVDGTLPPNLSLLSNGELPGIVAIQPTATLLDVGDETIFNFTIQAYSPTYPLITSDKEFNIVVKQQYGYPTDTLYIKATPSIVDREILETLLNNTTIIPNEILYRPTDVYFGKATSVVYEHAYGIYASDIDQYLAAVTQNHYWRNITLGEIKTAIAKNSNGEIIYEVVYSEVIDNLVNPAGTSIPETIIWPREIPLPLGSVRILHPNSLFNMRKRVGQVLGQEYDSSLLPLWMTSQQENGSTLGYTQAWVICYTKPGFSEIVSNNIKNNWVDTVGNPYELNQINFQIDRFSVDKSITYDFDNSVDPAAWTELPSATPPPDPLDSDDFYVIFPRKTILPND